jgi:hypothetical protein
MSHSSREPDAHKAKREAAKLLKSAEKSFRRWAKRVGGHLATAFGESIQQPKPKRAGAAGGRGTGQTNGCVASSVLDSDVPAGDYPRRDAHLSLVK